MAEDTKKTMEYLKYAPLAVPFAVAYGLRGQKALVRAAVTGIVTVVALVASIDSSQIMEQMKGKEFWMNAGMTALASLAASYATPNAYLQAGAASAVVAYKSGLVGSASIDAKDEKGGE